MILFYESNEDLAKRAGGVLSGGISAPWYDDGDSIGGLDIADYIESMSNDTHVEDDEYRDEREDYSKLADRHGC